MVHFGFGQCGKRPTGLVAKRRNVVPNTIGKLRKTLSNNMICHTALVIVAGLMLGKRFDLRSLSGLVQPVVFALFLAPFLMVYLRAGDRVRAFLA